MSKSRVAPLKSLTLPRLELMAAVSASRVAKFVQSSLSPSNTSITVRLWTDSQIVLHWLRNGSHAQSTNASMKSSNNFLLIPGRLLPQKTILQTFSLWEYLPLSWRHKAPTQGPGHKALIGSLMQPTGSSGLQLEIQASDTVEAFSPSTETTLDEKFEGILTVVDPSRYSRLQQLTAVTAYDWTSN